MKAQANSSVKTPLEYNQDQKPLMNEVRYDLLTISGAKEILCCFRLGLEGKPGKEMS